METHLVQTVVDDIGSASPPILPRFVVVLALFQKHYGDRRVEPLATNVHGSEEEQSRCSEELGVQGGPAGMGKQEGVARRIGGGGRQSFHFRSEKTIRLNMGSPLEFGACEVA